MKTRRILPALLLVLSAAIPSRAALSATSSDGNSGTASLVFSKIKATVGAQWIDIEEDAEISTAPSWGDGTGPWLVDGTFDVPTGTVVVGCLLWNDDTLLMGKLRGKADATHKFDSLVPVQPGYRYDPLLVEQVGDSTYHLKLYPVADGGTRRIRLRYLVPVVAVSGETSVLPVLAQAVSGLPANWILDLRGSASGLKLFHDNSWYPVDLPARRTLDFSTCGPTRLRWTTLSSDGTRAVRGRIDSGSWAGDYVLFTGKLPDSVARRVDIRSETVFLWRWIQPQSFLAFNASGYAQGVTTYGQQAIDQSRKMVNLSTQLVQMGNKVGLVADQGMDDTTIAFPLSDSAGSDFRRMKTWLNGIDVSYLQWRIPAPSSYTPDQGSLEIAKNRQRFRTDVVSAGKLYSKDSGIVRELVVVTVGPVPSGGDLQEMPDLSALPAGVSVASSQILQGTASCGYSYVGGVYQWTCPSNAPKSSQWPGVDLDGVAAARPVVGASDSIQGVPLPRFRRKVSGTLSITSSQGQVARDVVIQRGPDGSWIANLNVQAKGLGQQVSWKFFDDTGRTIASWTQTPDWKVADRDSALPRLWAVAAGRTTPNFTSYTSIAPLFGIVDLQYSLLAMSSDSMGRKVQAAYVDSGVPFLSDKDIFWKTGYGENPGSAIRAMARRGVALNVSLLSGRQVRIELKGLDARNVEIRDLRGHKVAEWNVQDLSGKVSVTWNGRTSSGSPVASGLYVVRVRTADRILSTQVALP